MFSRRTVSTACWLALLASVSAVALVITTFRDATAIVVASVLAFLILVITFGIAAVARRAERRAAQFRTMFDNMSDGFAIHDVVGGRDGAARDYVCVEMNSAFERLTGQTRDDVVGRRRRVPEFDRVAETGEPSKFNAFVPAVDRWLETVVYRAAERELGVVIRDVTERVKAEQVLRQSEERHRAVFEHSPDAILVRTGEFVVFANDAAAELLRAAAPGDLVGRRILDLIDEEFHAMSRERIRAIDSEQKPLPVYVNRFRRLDGTAFDVRVAAAPMVFDGRTSVQIAIRDITAELEARRALEASEERYRQVIEGMNEGLLVVEPDGRILYANKQLCRMLGRRLDELIGEAAAKSVAAGDMADVLEERRRRRPLGIADQYEAVLRRRSGEKFDALISGAPLNVRGKYVGSIALISDISERKRAEAKARESDARYRELVDSIPVHIFGVDERGRFETVNAAVCEFFGRSAAEIIGNAARDIGVGEPMASRWDEIREKVRSGGEPVECELSLRDRRFRATLTPRRDASGTFTGLNGVAFDITDQKTAEEALQKVMRAVGQMDEVLFLTDVNGAITYVNPAFEKVYGYTRDEVIGKNPRILKSGLVLGEQYRMFWSEILAGRSARFEFVNRTKSGSHVRVIASVSPVIGDDGRISGFSAVQQDITARRRAEDEQRLLENRLAQVARMEALGTLAGGIAHDFNNILAIILAHSTVIERLGHDPTRRDRSLLTIRQAVDRGAKLSKQILTFARRADTFAQPLPVGPLLKEVESMISETLPRTIRIQFDVGEPLPQIIADSGQLHQAVLNLCVNAANAMPNGGVLTLRARVAGLAEVRESFADARAAKYVCISVGDTGTGIPATARDHVFEPFYTTKEKGKGTGLGLSVVYGVVKAHEGFVQFDTEVDRGTEFRLYFPAPAVSVPYAEGLPQPGNVRAHAKRAEATLLLVEDETVLREILRNALAEAGFHVLAACDGVEAISLGQENARTVAAIVTDVGLPNMPAEEMLKTLLRMAPGVPVIAMTGYVDPKVHASIMNAGALRILQKPFSPDELVDSVRTMLEPVA